MNISNCPKRLEMTWNRFVSLLEVSLQSLGFLGCSEGEPGGGYICPKLVARVSEILYLILHFSLRRKGNSLAFRVKSDFSTVITSLDDA